MTPEWVGLSIRQPWIDLILEGHKTIEVRDWSIKRRGPILLHAARAMDWKTIELFGYRDPYRLPRGSLVGYAEITTVVELTRGAWLEHLERHLVIHPFASNRYGAVLGNVRKFQRPVPCSGKLMFFPIPASVHARVAGQMEQLGLKGGRSPAK